MSVCHLLLLRAVSDFRGQPWREYCKKSTHQAAGRDQDLRAWVRLALPQPLRPIPVPRVALVARDLQRDRDIALAIYGIFKKCRLQTISTLAHFKRNRIKRGRRQREGTPNSNEFFFPQWMPSHGVFSQVLKDYYLSLSLECHDFTASSCWLQKKRPNSPCNNPLSTAKICLFQICR